MAIEFRCECGKSLRAKDEFGGRKIRCPQCAEVVRIPLPEADDHPETPPAPEPAVAQGIAKGSPAPALVAVRPAAPPLAQPVAATPLAKPVAAKAAPITVAAPPTPHPWEDRSLIQTPTPWLPGDEERFQAGIKPLREGLSCWEKIAIGALIGAGCAGAIIAMQFV
ncbi:MAG: hypothetical protein L0Y71_17200 [Gemmataceae bacterium]|nr:hypothetical protein [Gemmataceae bacterium]